MSSKTGREAASWSLAARLTAWYAGTAFALVAGVGVFLYWALVASLDRSSDRFLADQVAILRGLLRERPDDPNAIRQEVEWESAARQHAPMFVRLLDQSGRTIIESPGMAEMLPAGAFPPAVAETKSEEAADLPSPEGRAFRGISARAGIGSAAPPTCILQVAVDRTHEGEILAAYRWHLWLALLTALLGCTVGGYWLARRGLRPVREIAGAAERIRPETLHQRIALAGLPAELAGLARTFNEMLDRLEESFARLARFSADIAHELRTPVNNLRGEAEVALAQPRPPSEYREVLGSCLEECGRLARTIDGLLFLARADHPQTEISRERMEIGRELEVLREFYGAAAEEAKIELAVRIVDDGCAELDRTLFQRAVGNLIENALAHTAPGGQVVLSGERRGTAMAVEVADTGCGIPALHLPHIFDRFYRVDASRSSTTGGVGLGLAIVKSTVELHGGHVEIASEVGRGTRVTLLFPAAAVAPQMTKA